MNLEEAAKLPANNPRNFLHIKKPGIDVANDVVIHAQAVYDNGAENLKRFIDDGTLIQGSDETLYVDKKVMGEHSQVDLVAVAFADAYKKDLIKKHESRPYKKDDRVAHMDALNAQVGPVLLTYKSKSAIDDLLLA